MTKLKSAPANLPSVIGAGKANPAVLLNTPECTTNQQSANKLTDLFRALLRRDEARWNYDGAC